MLSMLVNTLLLPAVPAALIAFVIPRPHDGRTRRRVSMLFAAALAAGALVSYQRVLGWPVFPPVEAKQWYPYGVVGALCGFGIASAIVPFRANRATPTSLLPAVPLGIVCAGSALVSMLGYSGSVAQLAAGLAATIGACAAVHLVRRNLWLGLGGSAVAVAALGMLMAITYLYTDAPEASSVLLLVGLVAAIAPLPLGRIARSWTLLVARTGMTAAPVAVAVLIAYVRYEPFSY